MKMAAEIITQDMQDVARTSREESYWGRARRRFARNKLAMVSLVVLLVMHGAVIILPYFLRYDPDTINLFGRFLRPGANGHLLGTDEMGRDVFARLVYGGRVSLGIGLSAMLGSVVIGTILGALAGFWGGWVDTVIMRITDAMLSFPVFFILLTLLTILGTSIKMIVLVIALTSWMNVARIVRGEVLRAKTSQYVEAAIALGNSGWAVLFRHILPQSISSIIVAATLGVAYSILTESSLSYLGLGVKPPTASWGNMLSGARSYIWSAPHLVWYPGLLIFITVLLYNALGDGLRDALDTSGRG